MKGRTDPVLLPFLKRNLQFISTVVLIFALEISGLMSETGSSESAHGQKGATPSPFVPEGLELVWHDEFDDSEFTFSHWRHRIDCKHFFCQRKENVKVENGWLEIKLSAAENTEQSGSSSFPFTAGGLVSEDSFGEGYYEVRAELTSDPGWWLSFWLSSMGDPSVFKPPEVHQEFDIFEHASGNCSFNSTAIRWAPHPEKRLSEVTEPLKEKGETSTADVGGEATKGEGEGGGVSLSASVEADPHSTFNSSLAVPPKASNEVARELLEEESEDAPEAHPIPPPPWKCPSRGQGLDMSGGGGASRGKSALTFTWGLLLTGSEAKYYFEGLPVVSVPLSELILGAQVTPQHVWLTAIAHRWSAPFIDRDSLPSFYKIDWFRFYGKKIGDQMGKEGDAS
uniref:GH16 domain-containing protein n=1 Tax=Chromera velia CCMP2878 TaxID=1169474 RepID=A0A0G4GY84_9ALVE|eukprot:Cvel_23881.t1-p1 / transcript=Cvel_23881.t1 / gene=Cvel_23881 / organism=Chromera_velia_CCMP2878 / gene_product=hypothetical protein / transcript_product=hypothetical protein / location=Cvel_scaffold2515:2289-5061(-) / protein_length=395 / sequence_SO=supercontig / SO=protein_coding / is_pseudo=false